MEQPIDHIADIESEVQLKTRLYSILLRGIVCFMILPFISTLYYRTWDFIFLPFVLIIIPLAAFFLLRLRKKAGWVMAVFYFELYAVALCAFFYNNIRELRHLSWYHFGHLITITYFVLSSFLLYLLLSRPVRRFLTVRSEMFLLTAMISTALSFVIVIVDLLISQPHNLL